MTAMLKNSLGRLVPDVVNGLACEPYLSAFAQLANGPKFCLPTIKEQGRGKSKVVKSLEHVVESCLPDNGWISFPHYYRDDPTALEIVINALRNCKKRGIKLMGNAFFDSHADLLAAALRDGVLQGFEGNTYGAVAKLVASGSALPWVVIGRSHGGRARAFQCGDREVDLAIAPVPIADCYGNANGVMGHPASMCGPISLFEPDARWAKRTVLLTEQIQNTLLVPNPIDMRHVDFVVPVNKSGDNRGIATGTTDIRRVKGDRLRDQIAFNVLSVIEASEVIAEGFNFQIGSGSGLLVLEQMLRKMRALGIRGGFTAGGSMDYHVDLLREGLIETFLDGQCFQPSTRLFESLRTDHRHVEVSTSFYYSPASKDPAVNLMDVVVLGGSEVDINFNVNTVTGYDGVMRTGIGGGPDAAAGGKLTLFALPLARVNRSGLSCPCVRDNICTIVTPGEVVSAIVTEDFVALNERNSSPHLNAIRNNAADYGLKIISIEEMAERARAKALELGTLMAEPRFTDDVLVAIEWRDGRLLDVVRKLEK